MDDVRHDEAARRFVIAAPGGDAVLLYEPLDQERVDFVSTFVPPALRGRNVGTRLVAAALDWARERGLKVVPSCWFVAEVMERVPGYADLRAS